MLTRMSGSSVILWGSLNHLWKWNKRVKYSLCWYAFVSYTLCSCSSILLINKKPKKNRPVKSTATVSWIQPTLSAIPFAYAPSQDHRGSEDQTRHLSSCQNTPDGDHEKCQRWGYEPTKLTNLLQMIPHFNFHVFNHSPSVCYVICLIIQWMILLNLIGTKASGGNEVTH